MRAMAAIRSSVISRPAWMSESCKMVSPSRSGCRPGIGTSSRVMTGAASEAWMPTAESAATPPNSPVAVRARKMRRPSESGARPPSPVRCTCAAGAGRCGSRCAMLSKSPSKSSTGSVIMKLAITGCASQRSSPGSWPPDLPVR